jgi:hypothetical protein
VNIRTSIITAAATLALFAPVVANAAPTKAPGLHAKKPVTAVLLHPGRGKAGPIKIVKRPYPVTYIHVTTTYPSGLVEVDPCQLSGNDCTPQQACELWIVSCDELSAGLQTDSTPVIAPSSPLPAAESTAGDPGATGLTDASTVSSTPDAGSIDDTNDC